MVGVGGLGGSSGVSKPLRFEGIAHPRAHSNGRQNPADLNSAEIDSIRLGSRGRDNHTTPVLYEHDGPPVGRVLTSWKGKDGSLRVAGTIHDPETIAGIRSRATLGLSLGTNVIHERNGLDRPLVRTVEELSVCGAPRRPGCWIDEVDGKRIPMSRNRASAQSGARPLAPPITPYSCSL